MITVWRIIQRETPKRKKGELYSYHQKLEVSTKSKKYEAVQGLAAWYTHKEIPRIQTSSRSILFLFGLPNVFFQLIGNSDTDFGITYLTHSRQNKNVPTMKKRWSMDSLVIFAHTAPIIFFFFKLSIFRILPFTVVQTKKATWGEALTCQRVLQGRNLSPPSSALCSNYLL